MITHFGINKNFSENNLWWKGPEILKLKKEKMFQFSILESNVDTKVRETFSTGLNANKLTCNVNNIINLKRYINNDKVLRIAA